MIDKVKTILATMHVNLIRIKLGWETSGSGEGGFRGDCTTNDGEDVREAMDKANFLQGLPAYHLILWELADKHGLLESTLQILDASVGAADASSAPSVIRNVPRGSPTDSTMGRTAVFGMVPEIVSALDRFSDTYQRENESNRLQDQMTNVLNRLSALEDQRLQLRRERRNAVDAESIADVDADLEAVEREREQINTERRDIERAIQTESTRL
jgi:hypothetical protein